MTPSNRLVLVTTSLPPAADSQTTRLRHLLAAFHHDRWRIELVSPASRLSGDAAIAMLGWRGQWRWRDAEPGRSDSFFRTGQGLSGRAGWFVKNCAYRLMYPDHFGYWTSAAVRTLRQCLREGEAVVMTSSGSPAAHLAALRALDEKQRRRWVADFGDPWAAVDLRLRPHWYWRALLDERRCLRNARLVLCTTEPTRNLFLAGAGGNARVEVLPYGFEAGPDAEATEPPSNVLCLSYTGAAHVRNRNLIPLIEALARHASDGAGGPVRMTLAGNYSEVFVATARRLGVPMIARGLVPYAEAVRIGAASSCQVIVGNKEALQVPGKVFVALGIAAPVLYLGQASVDIDPSWQLMKDLPGVIRADNNTGSIAEALLRLRGGMEELRQAARARQSDPRLRRFEAREISTRFLKMITDLMPV